MVMVPRKMVNFRTGTRILAMRLLRLRKNRIALTGPSSMFVTAPLVSPTYFLGKILRVATEWTVQPIKEARIKRIIDKCRLSHSLNRLMSLSHLIYLKKSSPFRLLNRLCKTAKYSNKKQSTNKMRKLRKTSQKNHIKLSRLMKMIVLLKAIIPFGNDEVKLA